MQLPHIVVVPLLFGNLCTSVIDFGLLVGTLSAGLVDLSLTVLRALLQLTKALRFLLFLLLHSESFSHLRLFSLLLLALMLGNFLIKSSLSGTSSFFLLQRGSIGDSNLLLHRPDPVTLGLRGGCFFPLDFLDVCKKLCLFLLANLLILHSLLLTRRDLIDQDLSTSFASVCCSLLSLKLSFDGLKTLNFHHHIQSLLFRDPVLLHLIVFTKLTLANGVYFRCIGHLVHMLHVVVLLVHLGLSTCKYGVLAKVAHLDLERRIRLTLPVLPLHSLLPGDGHSHLFLSTLALRLAQRLDLSLAPNDRITPDTIEFVAIHDRDR